MASVDLHDQITKSGCFCLNELSSAPHSNLFVGDHTLVLRSDADEQLIIHIEFLQTMKLSSLSLGLPNDDSCPHAIKLFCNNRNLGFSQAADETGAQTLTIKAPDAPTVTSFPLLAHKWKNVDANVCASFYQSGSVFPMYRQWKSMDLQKLHEFNSRRKSYGVSLFPLVEAKLVIPLLQKHNPPLVCAMDVEKLKDLDELYDAGCRFISTHVGRREVIREAQLKGMTVICIGSLSSDYNDAVMLNVDGFRLRLDKPLKFKDGKEFLDRILLANRQLEIPLFVSPVIEGDDMEKIAALDGMIQFMMSFTVEDDGDANRAQSLLSMYDERLRKAYLDLRIKEDLHSSCL